MSRELKIDKEFAGLCPELRKKEFALLKEQIEASGCTDPIIYWDGEDIVVDGHNRLRICKELDLPYKTHGMAFAGREEVRLWIMEHALGRRNLTDAQFSVLIGNYYAAMKKHRGEKTGMGPTAKLIANEQGISVPTVVRHSRYAGALKQIADTGGQDLAKAILSGEVKGPKLAIEKVATNPRAIRKARDLLAEGRLKNIAQVCENGAVSRKPERPVPTVTAGNQFETMEHLLGKLARAADELQRKIGSTVCGRSFVEKLRLARADLAAWKRAVRP